MIDKNYIIKTIKEYRNSIESKGVESIALFGSFANDSQTDKSDIDLIVKLNKDAKNFDNFMDLAFLLEDIFERDIELITEESLSEDFFRAISKDLIYAY